MDAEIRSQWISKIEVLCRENAWKYAQFLCMEFLFQYPDDVAVRQLLQKIRTHFCPRHWGRFLKKTFWMLWYCGHLKKCHRELLATLDQLLNEWPHCTFLWRILAEVASSFALYETAVFAIQAIQEEKRNTADRLLLGEAFYALNDYTGAVAIANQVLAKTPDHIRARDLLWQASVDQSMAYERI